MPQTNLGRVAFKFQGDYSALTTYAKYDVVFDGESSFVSQIDNNLGNELVDGLNWKYLAKGNALLSEQNAEDIAQTRTDLNTDIANLISDEFTIADALNLLYSKITALEKLISDGILGNIQVEQLTSAGDIRYKGAQIIVLGTTAPTTTPDFEGQTYINTSGGITYTAKGTGSVSDWKQTSN